MVGASAARQAIRLVVAFSVTASLFGGAYAQSSDDLELREYAALLKEINDQRTMIAYKKSQIDFQEARIEHLTSEISRVPAVTSQIEPMMDVMVEKLKAERKLDLPFNVDARDARFASLKDLMANKKASAGEKMRRILEVYSIEASYGSTVESYEGYSPFPDRRGYRYEICSSNEQAYQSVECGLDDEKREAIQKGQDEIYDFEDEILDGDYLRIGRLALAYMEKDGSSAYRYDPKSATWVQLDGNDFLEVRRAVRVAKGEVAPNVMSAPLYIR